MMLKWIKKWRLLHPTTIVLAAIFTCFGCSSPGPVANITEAANPGNSHEYSALNWVGLSKIEKGPVFLANAMESTPFVFRGRLLLAVFIRADLVGTNKCLGDHVSIFDASNHALVASIPFIGGLGAAFVDSGRLYLFGSVNWCSHENPIVMTSSNDLTHWSNLVTVFSAEPEETIFNLSVDRDPTGFILAYETKATPNSNFSPRFAHSTDLIHWSRVGGTLEPSDYAACPTIRYVDGAYYIFYLRQVLDAEHNPEFVTFIAKTTDFETFYFYDNGANQVIAPSLSGEGNNASDFDLAEYNGTVFISYADGDQKTWTDVRTAAYPGTLSDLVHEFF